MVARPAPLLEAGAKAAGRASAVVNISSVAGISGIGSSIAYAASKGVLNTITLSLERALATLIRVRTRTAPAISIRPGSPRAAGSRRWPSGARFAWSRECRSRRLQRGEDVAEIGCFLATSTPCNMDRRSGADGNACMHLIISARSDVAPVPPGPNHGRTDPTNMSDPTRFRGLCTYACPGMTVD